MPVDFKFSDYKDFPDFCIKNQMTPEQGFSFLLNKLIEERKEKYDNKRRIHT